MIEMMKPEIKCGTVKVHDTKKFRLRAVSTEFEVYAKYFKRTIAKRISYAQIALAFVIAIAQICTVSLMTSNYTKNEYLGVGVCASILVSFAAGTTLLASRRPNYCKLHSSMALHIVALLSHVLLVLIAVTKGIPRLSHSLTYTINQNHLKARAEEASNLEYQGSYAVPYYVDYRYQYYDSDLEPVSLIGMNLFLTSLMSIAGVLQIVLSFVAAIMTGRAMCSGRTNLEGKFFELDPVGLGNLMNYRAASIREKDRYRHSSNSSQKKEVNCDSKEDSMEEVTLSSPPSYESGIFHTDAEANVISKT